MLHTSSVDRQKYGNIQLCVFAITKQPKLQISSYGMRVGDHRVAG